MEKDRLRASFERILPRKEEFAAAFYQRLQGKHPQLQAFFAHTDMRRQQATLLATLTVLVTAGGRDEDLLPTFRRLGQLHRQREILPQQYPAFGNTLMETLSEFDPEWTQAEREVWSKMLDRCVRGMMESYDPEEKRYRVQVIGMKRRDTL